MPRKHEKIGEILLHEGLLTEEQLKKAVEEQSKGSKELLGQILIRQGAISEKDLALSLSKQFNIPYASKETLLLNQSKAAELTKLIPEAMARDQNVLPIAAHYKSLTVALVDPTDLVLLDNLHQVTGYSIQPVIATPTDIQASIEEFYGEGGMLKSAVEASYTEKEEGGPAAASDERLLLDNIVASAKKAPVVNLTNLLLCQAVKDRASDIHIEPYENKVSIRFRIDGVLHEVPSPEKSMILPLISRIKILSKMDISEKRLPQDGSLKATIEKKEIDFRVSTIPTVHGEKIVMRILDRSSTTLSIESLNLDDPELKKYRVAIHKPYGLILLTGPTGSGKTTTLYIALNELKGKDKNITTIEDPVEYEVEGINQVQVKPGIGLTFASGLRAFLRQDPDVILVGETRDLETAQICVRAAMTGHLVLSTLHTNDAPSAITRLTDIGVEPFFVGSSLLLVIAQRLVRRLCPKCKTVDKMAPDVLPEALKKQKGTIYRAKGCGECGNTGYRGRFAIFEMMAIDEKIQHLVNQKAPTSQIREAARQGGMQTLEESAFKKVLAGETSLEEVLRVTMASTD